MRYGSVETSIATRACWLLILSYPFDQATLEIFKFFHSFINKSVSSTIFPLSLNIKSMNMSVEVALLILCSLPLVFSQAEWEDVGFRDYPFMALLKHNGSSYCGGSIISKSPATILTSGTSICVHLQSHMAITRV